MFSVLKPIAPFIDYAINQDYVAEFLCMNQDKPEMQCNGKCHLFKEVKKQKEETPVSLQMSLKQYYIGCIQILNIYKKIQVTSNKKDNHFYAKDYNYVFAKIVLDPPII